MQPRTIVQLIIVGFIVVLSPLIVSLFNATRSLDAITLMNENSIADVVTITRFNRDVSEALVDMERVSRQYQLLGEEGLVSVYQKKLEFLRQAAAVCASIADPEAFLLFGQLIDHGETLLGVMKNSPKNAVTCAT